MVEFRCDWKFNAHDIGNSKIISRSKRINRIATRKNFIEKGSRADPEGSNPHSYGESFSLFGRLKGKNLMTRRRNNVIRIVINSNKIVLIISFWEIIFP